MLRVGGNVGWVSRQLLVISVISAITGVAGGAPADAPKLATAPSTRPATRPATVPAEHAITRAYELITADKFDEARAAVEPIVKREPSNARANLGYGYALLRLGRVKDALPALEKAYAAQPSDRTLVLTLASALQEENPMRGVRVLRDYMSTPSRPVDEELQNALGSILNRAAKDVKVNKEGFFQESREFYMTYDQRLNEAHGHGEKHWGAQWVPIKEAETKWNIVITRQKKYAEASRTAEISTQATAKAKDQLQFVNNGFGLHSTRERQRARTDYEAAVSTEKKAYQERERAEKALEKAEQPPFLKSVPTPPFWQKE
jgi:tetratricopeptide (TPR) repeat protein